MGQSAFEIELEPRKNSGSTLDFESFSRLMQEKKDSTSEWAEEITQPVHEDCCLDLNSECVSDESDKVLDVDDTEYIDTNLSNVMNHDFLGMNP